MLWRGRSVGWRRLLLLVAVSSWSSVASADLVKVEFAEDSQPFAFSASPPYLRLFRAVSHTTDAGTRDVTDGRNRNFPLPIGDVSQIGETIVLEILPSASQGTAYGRTDYNMPYVYDYDLGIQEPFFCLGDVGSTVFRCTTYLEVLRAGGSEPPAAAEGEFVRTDIIIEVVSAETFVSSYLFQNYFRYRVSGQTDFSTILEGPELAIASPAFGVAHAGSVVEFEFEGIGDVGSADHLHLKIDDQPIIEVPLLARSPYRLEATTVADTGAIGTHLAEAWLVDAQHASIGVGTAQTVLITVPNTSPIAIDDVYESEQSTLLRVAAGSGVLGNDYDPDGHPLTAALVEGPANGSVTLHPGGAFDYLPDPLFHGEDTFRYQTRDFVGGSPLATVHIRVSSHDRAKIGIELETEGGAPIAPGAEVSDFVLATISVHGALGYHAQFYSNFEVLPTREPGHLVDRDPWTRTAIIDTRSFFDGENLISVHAHPHNRYGQVYNTEFEVGLFLINSSNERPAPSGDRKLPELIIADRQFVPKLNIFDDRGWRLSGIATVVDDGEWIKIGSSRNTAGAAQVIPHLGSTVMGRGRWVTQTPAFADGTLISDVRLAPFQGDEEYTARIVFFLSDEVGRANYAFREFTMPSITEAQAEAMPLPGADAFFLGVSQGESLVLSVDRPTVIDVLITDPRPILDTLPILTTWVGNRSVATTDLRPMLEHLPQDQTSFVVQVEIPTSEIELLEYAREGGQGSTAFAFWHDFASSLNSLSSDHYPTSTHIHLSSIRTEDYLDEIYLHGGHGDEVLEGTKGGDVIAGGGGSDNLFGRRGADLLLGGSGSDTIDGGDGWDTASFSGRSSDYSVEVFGRVTRVAVGPDVNWLTDIEALTFVSGSRTETLEVVEGTWVRIPEPQRHLLTLAMLAALAFIKISRAASR